MRFVLATRNPHKLAEYRAILAPHDVGPMPAGIELPPEGVVSFEANARAKAEGLARALRAGAAPVGGAPAGGAAAGDAAVVVADDSGIEVAALGGAPGVISARYAGHEGDDVANNARLLTELRALPGEHERSARFVCVIAYRHAGRGRRRCRARRVARRDRGGRPGHVRLRLRPALRARRPATDRGRDGRGRQERSEPPGARGARAARAPRRRCEARSRRPRPAVNGTAVSGLDGAARKARAAWLSIAANAALIVFKLVAGLLSGSIGIISEAAHSDDRPHGAR